MKKSKKRNNNSKIILYFLLAFFLCGIIFSIYIYGFLKPSNNRDWEIGVSKLPRVTIQNSVVSIKNVRDFRYSQKGLIATHYTKRTIPINDLEKVWFVFEPFEMEPVSRFFPSAHTFFVFDVKNQDPIALSVETRREKDEDFNVLWGLINRYELIYIWGSEKDLTGRRVIVEDNKVYMYPLSLSKNMTQKLFLELAKATHDLENTPRFYNTFSSNCTSELTKIANKVNPGSVPVNIASILPGLAPEQLYVLGFIKNDKPFKEVEKSSLVSSLVKKYYSSKHFSEDIRKNLPY